MPLTPQEQQELAELEELERLEAKFGQEKIPDILPQDVPGSGVTEINLQEGAPKSFQELKERFQDPTRWQAILGTGPRANLPGKQVIQGAPPMALPAGQLPAMVGKTAQFLQGGPVRRFGTSAGVTYAETKNPLASIGVGLLNAVGLPIKGMARRSKLQGIIKSPEKLQQVTGEAVESARGGIVEKIGAEKGALLEELQGKTIKADLNRFKGIAKDIDEMIDDAGTQIIDETGTPVVDAVKYQHIKQRLDQLAKWPKGTQPTPEQLAARDAANEARDVISTASPRAAEINLRLAGSQAKPGLIDVKETLPSKFSKGVSPSTEFVKSKSPRKQVAKEIAFKETGVDLPTLGKEISGAEKLQFKLSDLLPFNWPQAAVKAAGRGLNFGARTVEPATSAATDPRAQMALIEAMRKKEK